MNLPLLNNFPFLNNLSFFNNLPFFKNSNTPYWIKIKTDQPKCIYYFGPFDNPQEAKLNQDGYVEDLIDEKALGISASVKKCKPKTLTIYEEE